MGLVLLILLRKSILYRPFHAFYTLVHKLLKLRMVKLESLPIPCLFDLILQAVKLFQVKYLLDEKQNLNGPILARFPFVKICLESQISRTHLYKWMKNARLEGNFGHWAWIVLREGQFKFNYGVLVDSLLAKVDAKPLLQMTFLLLDAGDHKNTNGSKSLQKLILKGQRLNSDLIYLVLLSLNFGLFLFLSHFFPRLFTCLTSPSLVQLSALIVIRSLLSVQSDALLELRWHLNARVRRISSQKFIFCLLLRLARLRHRLLQKALLTWI